MAWLARRCVAPGTVAGKAGGTVEVIEIAAGKVKGEEKVVETPQTPGAAAEAEEGSSVLKSVVLQKRTCDGVHCKSAVGLACSASKTSPP